MRMILVMMMLKMLIMLMMVMTMMMLMMMICQGWLTKVSAHSADDLGWDPTLIFLSNASP